MEPATSTDQAASGNPHHDAPETVTVTEARVCCDGGGGALGHPRVWLVIGGAGFVDCPYCGRRFQRQDAA